MVVSIASFSALQELDELYQDAQKGP